MVRGFLARGYVVNISVVMGSARHVLQSPESAMMTCVGEELGPIVGKEG
jgi:hypothetical protein